MNKYDFSLILPCFNEAEHFTQSLKKIISSLDQTDYTYEIILVEDYSTDKTKGLVEAALTKYSDHNLSAIFHPQNIGRGQSVIDGFKQSQGKIIGFIDFDLEVGEWYLPKFIRVVESGYDVANAWRIYDFNLRSLIRWLSSKGYVWLQKQLINLPFHDTEAGYKFFNRAKIMPLINQCHYQGWFFDTEILALAAKKHLKIKEIPVAFVRREDKTSTVRLIPDSLGFLKNLIIFSWKFKHV
ncbi:MAG: glycosyltransferase [Patescibacteria group bacterium]